MKCLKYLLFAAALTAAGCSDEGTSKPLVSPDAGATADSGAPPDGSTSPDAGVATPDGGGVTPDGGTTQTLVELVTDIVENKTNETALPESIDDKMLTDTMDPAAFNALF